MLRLTLTVFRMVPISSSLLHCAPGKQRDLLSTSPDRYARLFSKDVRVLKRDGRKTLPNKPDIGGGRARYRAARRGGEYLGTSAVGGH